MNEMINRNRLRNLLVAFAVACMGGAMTTGCSDNVEDGLYADSESHITLSVSASGFQNGLLTIGSAQSATVFTVASTTRWTVEVTDCEGAWCQITYGESSSDEAGHLGDGTFTVEAAPNRSGNPRECNVTVYAIQADGTHIPGKSVLIHLTQDRQSILVDYAGDVISPYGTTTATEPVVTVTANQSWSVSSSHDWITVIPGADMTGDGFVPAAGSTEEKAVSFRFSVSQNPGTSTRSGEITISSPTSAFTAIRLNVTQEGSSATFLITPTNVPVVAYGGEVIEFHVYSPRESWTARAISSGDWLTLDRTSGEASSEPVTVRATVAANPLATSRQGGIVFTREGGMGESTVSVTQQGSLDVPDPNYDPVVSTPWLISGWTSSWVQIRAYYLSPMIEVTGCGAFIHPVADEDDVQTFYGRLGENNLMIIDMNNLEPDTEYKTWAFVSYTLNGTSMVTTGGATYFTTPDRNGTPGSDHQTPDLGDNPPPSIN